MDNKRVQPRISFREPVQYRLQRSEASVENGIERTGAGLSCDLNENGIRIRSNDFVPLNTFLFIDFLLKSHQPMQIQGRVVWIQKLPHSESYQMGVKFDRSSKEVLIPALQEYLEVHN